ncbi:MULTISPECIES: nitroreductase family deazaflavin-dependent oxidoreductase [unclassified Pseudonocardia]|jgi:deazaflavin-dependent oxidoreductase (nitroreductase family)|uniref:nitroreductase family deazaflavin-dependent oxidoreductase n=1 Tax=unclassified Pseudonocardia TaxID=2619320 RepID=UPI0025EA4164|nr:MULTISPECIES: nitroreductase family deazaflavin-dependent oxidoreductase [unclassified Pseudonocardia]
MRAPIWIYRMRLGFLFGSRMLMLEHVGRRTGQRRRVVLEVFGHPASDRYLVVSGFGDRAQWFRNVRAHPQVRVSVAGRRSVPATARVLGSAEADAALARYAARYPRAWRTFKPVLESTLGTSIDQEHTALPIVELRTVNS